MAQALTAPAPEAPPLATMPVRIPGLGPNGEIERVQLRNPAQANVVRNVLDAARRVREGLPMIRALGHFPRPALVVGTGPSLDRREVRREVRRLARKGAVVYALKSAATILVDELGVMPDYVVNVDAQASQVEKMPRLAAPTYLIGSCCDPALYDWLLDGGCKVEVFHSACGARLTEHGSELEFYRAHFPDCWVAQGGMTVANRAIAVALGRHGCKGVYLAGCDFGSRVEGAWYAAGTSGRMGPGVLWITDGGETDGTPWFTQPSLIVAAVSAAQLVRAGFVRILGDSLAAAFAANPAAMAKAVSRVV